jgi:sulfoxide reductase heme-binding subunit YedZ
MFKLLTFLLCLLPLEYSIYQVHQLQTGGANVLGADPAKELVLLQGEWAIRFLLLTLLVTPVRRLTGWRQAQKIRRMLGLFTFAYASIHLLAYLFLLLELDFRNLGAAAPTCLRCRYPGCGARDVVSQVQLFRGHSLWRNSGSFTAFPCI